MRKASILKGTDRLTERQRRFARRYAEHGNGARAARDAGYSDVAEGAKVTASTLLTKPNIQAAVAEHAQSLMQRAGYDPVESVREHMHRARYDQEEGRRPDPVAKAATDTLLKMAGALEADKGEQHAHLHLSGLSREQLEAIEARLEGREPADGG